MPAAIPSLLLMLMLTLVTATRAHANGEEDARRLGDFFRMLNPALALGATFYEHDVGGRKQLALSLGTTLVATELAKRAFNHTDLGKRPNGDDYGFPSGHVSTTCSSAAFLHHRYGWRYALPLYATSAYTAYSRVDSDKHHWRDVIAGCALAYGISTWLVSPRHDDRIEIAPLLDDGGAIGLKLRLSF